MLTLLEPLISSATESLATVIFDIVRTSGGKLIQTYSDRRVIAKASNEYARKYAERHGILRVLGMREPVPLESVYTEVQFLSEWEHQRFATVEVLEEAFRQDSKRSFQSVNAKTQDGLVVAEDKQYLVVLGEPGVGKSTFLKKTGLEALKGLKSKQTNSKNKQIPVFIELKRLSNNQSSIKSLIEEEFRICNFPSHSEFTKTVLNQGRLLILLDGLDEVQPDKATMIVSQIQDFVDEYDKNRFVISCRVAAYRRDFQRFTDIVIADFSDAQIEGFIYRWFRSDIDKEEETAKRFWQLLQKPEYIATKELAYRPLFLTFLCLVYDRSQNLPGKRSVLYRRALDILLEEWSAEKRTYQTAIYHELDVELEKILLSEIAYRGFLANRLFFSEEEIVNQIKKFLTNTLNKPRPLNGKVVLDAIATQQGILVERAEYIYSFSHLTLQEYLTARYISQDYRRVSDLVECHLTERRWQEVFMLVAGLMVSGDELLIAMEQQAYQLLGSPTLRQLLNWTSHATNSNAEKSAKSVIERIIILYLVLEVVCGLDANLNFEFGYGFALLNSLNSKFAKRIRLLITQNISNNKELAHRLATFFNEKKMFQGIDLNLLIAKLEAVRFRGLDNGGKSFNKRRLFSEDICKVWIDVFKLSDEVLKISIDEIKAIENYFYACLLIFRCKEEAVRVSPKVWRSIEMDILLINK